MKVMRVTVKSFLSLLIIGMLATCLTGYRTIGKAVYLVLKEDTSYIDKADSLFRAIDTAVSDGFIFHNIWIDLYGGIQKGLHKDFVPDANDAYTVIVGSDEKLYFTGTVFSETERDLEESHKSLKGLYKYCNKNNIEMLYVTAPHKYYSSKVNLPVSGVHDFYDDTISFHNALKVEGIPELNLMEEWAKCSENYSDGFFTTDHHWNIRTAFWGFQRITDIIAEPSEERLVQEHCFTEDVEENVFLGAMGTRVGRFFAGKDDISIISPTYETDFCVTYNSKTLSTPEVRKGDWDEAILSKPVTYTMYITSDNQLIHVENKNIKSGRNILLIKDSFGVPVAAWLSCMYKNMWEMDLRYSQNESVYDFIEHNDIDVVVILYNPEAIGNSVFYKFDAVS